MNYLADGINGLALFSDEERCVKYWQACNNSDDGVVPVVPTQKNVPGFPAFLGARGWCASDMYSDFVFTVPKREEVFLLFHGENDSYGGWTGLWCARNRDQALKLVQESLEYTNSSREDWDDEEYEEHGLSPGDFTVSSLISRLRDEDSLVLGDFWWEIQRLVVI